MMKRIKLVLIFIIIIYLILSFDFLVSKQLVLYFFDFQFF